MIWNTIPCITFLLLLSSSLGNRRGAGTDANVYVTLYGENGDTGPRRLEAAKKPFQRGRTDIFSLEAVDIGAIKRIKIGHDGDKPGAGWFVEKVIVKSEALAKEWYFLAGRWLAKDEDDGKIELELLPKDEDGATSPPLVTYRFAVITGDRPGAGTGNNISLRFSTVYLGHFFQMVFVICSVSHINT